MILNELNIFIFLIFNVLLIILINPINFLNILILTEIIWVLLYGITIILSYLFDEFFLLSLTFFFLLFSAAELIVGFILILIQNVLLFNTNLYDTFKSNTSYLTRFKTNIYNNKLNIN